MGEGHHTAETPSAKALFEAIMSELEADEDLKPFWRYIDYIIFNPYGPESFPEDYSHILAVANPGGSEGIYIDIDICFRNRMPASWGTVKTLREDYGAYKAMGELAGAFTYKAYAILEDAGI